MSRLHLSLNTSNFNFIDAASNSLFYLDGNTTRVGMGTTAPATRLHVQGETTVAGDIIPSADLIYSLGTPTHRFKDLYIGSNTIYLGDTKISSGAAGIIFKDNNDNLQTIQVSQLVIGTSSNNIVLSAPSESNAGPLQALANIYGVGSNVGIGSTDPAHPLDVLGAVNTSVGYKINGAALKHADLSGTIPSTAYSNMSIPGSALMDGATSQWSGLAGSAIYYNAANVGVGTATPLSKLHVQGDAKITSNLTIDGSLTVRSLTYLQSNVTIYASETVQSNLTINGLTTTSNLKVAAGGTLVHNATTLVDTAGKLTQAAFAASTVPQSALSNVTLATLAGTLPQAAFAATTVPQSALSNVTLATLTGTLPKAAFAAATVPQSALSNVTLATLTGTLPQAAFAASTVPQSALSNVTLATLTGTLPQAAFAASTVPASALSNVKYTDLSGFVPTAAFSNTSIPTSAINGVLSQWSGAVGSNLSYVAANVGLGTATPTERLDVVGNVKVSASVTAASFTGSGAGLSAVPTSALTGTLASSTFAASSVPASALSNVKFTDLSGFVPTAAFSNSSIPTTALNGVLSQWSGAVGSDLSYVTANVGVGTATPTVRLDVVGDAKVSGSVTATSFTGSGAGLSAVPTSALTGTLAQAAFAANTVPQSALSNVTLGTLTGTLPQAAFAASTVPQSALSNVTLGTLTGTLPQAAFAASTVPASALSNVKFTDLSGFVPTAAFSNSSIPTTALNGVLSQWSGAVGSDLSYVAANVGVGTATPTVRLDVAGDAKVSGWMTAQAFSGSGAGLTNVSTSSLIGTLATSNFAANTVPQSALSNVTLGSLTGTLTQAAFAASTIPQSALSNVTLATLTGQLTQAAYAENSIPQAALSNIAWNSNSIVIGFHAISSHATFDWASGARVTGAAGQGYDSNLANPGSCWNATTGYFTPTVAGYYSVAASAYVRASNQNFTIRKNATTAADGTEVCGSEAVVVAGTETYATTHGYIYMNGLTDTLSLWAGAVANGISITNSPANFFCAYLTQSVGTAVQNIGFHAISTHATYVYPANTQVTGFADQGFNSIVANTGSCWNSNGVFQPTAEGFYMVSASGYINTAGQSMTLRKNATTATDGTELAGIFGNNASGTANHYESTSAYVYMNGTTDTLSAWSGANGIAISNSPGNYFMAYLIANGVGNSQWTGSPGSNIYYTGGNVGFGTTNPTQALDVVGSAKVSGSVTAQSFTGSGAGLTNLSMSGLAGTLSTSSFAANTIPQTALSNITLGTLTGTLQSSAFNGVSATSLANVGVGTASPQAKLHVVGDARFSSNLTVDGILTVNNLSYFQSNITIYASETVQSNLSINGLATACNLTVLGAATLSSLVAVGKGGSAVTDHAIKWTNGTYTQGYLGNAPAFNAGAMHLYQNGGATPVVSLQAGVGGASYINNGGNIGIGTSTPASTFDVNGQILARNGNSAALTTATQIALGYAGTASYMHSIKTRHHGMANTADNAIDFYVWQTSDSTTAMGTKQAMSVTSAGVGIGTTTPTQALDVVGNINVSGTVSSANPFMFKNAVINGDFRVNQRGTPSTWPGVGTTTTIASADQRYVGDRWMVYRGSYAAGSCSLGTLTTTDLPFTEAGIRNQARFGRTSGDTSTQYCAIWYSLESADSYRLVGQQVTLSFYVRCGANFSGTGNTINARVLSGTGIDQRLDSFTGTNAVNSPITVSTSWSRVQVTATMPPSTTQVHVDVNYYPASPSTAGANDWLEVTGFQLEKGSLATPFEFRPYAVELQLCQRYYYRRQAETTFDRFGMGVVEGPTYGYVTINLPNRMRALPTNGISALGHFTSSGVVIGTVSTYAASTANNNSTHLGIIAFSTTGGTVGTFLWTANNTTSAWVEFSAEL